MIYCGFLKYFGRAVYVFALRVAGQEKEREQILQR